MSYHKFDFHLHSRFSYDSLSSITGILKASRRMELSGIALTDHEKMEGANKLESAKLSRDMLIIRGIEVKTEYGDMIGLFLRSPVITSSFHEFVLSVKKQGGIVVLPHPFKTFQSIPEFVLKSIEIIEVQNSRLTEAQNRKAVQFAMKRGIPMIAGSDAHRISQVGRSWVEFESIDNMDDLKEQLLSGAGSIKGNSSPRYDHYWSSLIGNLRKRTLLKTLARKTKAFF